MAHELLNGLSSAEADQVLALGTRMTVPSGGSLFRLGDAADRLFLIERGRIRLTFPMLVRGREEEVLIEEKGARRNGGLVGAGSSVPLHPFRDSAAGNGSDRVAAGEALRLLRALACSRFQNRHESGHPCGTTSATCPGDVDARNGTHCGTEVCRRRRGPMSPAKPTQGNGISSAGDVPEQKPAAGDAAAYTRVANRRGKYGNQ